MVHPAHNENTGTVLLEAIAAGLPVLATDVCGYADHITAAEAGTVLDSPFDQEDAEFPVGEHANLSLSETMVCKWPTLRQESNPLQNASQSR